MLSIYRKQVEAILDEIEQLAIEYSEPHTISITAYFNKWTMTHDIRLIRSDDEETGDAE